MGHLCQTRGHPALCLCQFGNCPPDWYLIVPYRRHLVIFEAAGRPAAMAELHELAVQYQRALDGTRGSIPSAAVDAASNALYHRIVAELKPDSEGIFNDYNFLEPIILRTTLATSAAAYLERIPWTAVTPQMLSQPAGTPLGAVRVCSLVLGSLLHASRCIAGRGSNTVPAALLLRQIDIMLPSVCHRPVIQSCRGSRRVSLPAVLLLLPQRLYCA